VIDAVSLVDARPASEGTCAETKIDLLRGVLLCPRFA
jgi:hypothetical protein